jgi:hypothetical protein
MNSEVAEGVVISISIVIAALAGHIVLWLSEEWKTRRGKKGK